jgi:hypothetical protein
MAVTKLGSFKEFIIKYPKSFITAVVALAIIIYLIKITFNVLGYLKTIEFALTPPELPKVVELETEHLNPDGWGDKSDDWFHFVSQGTATIPIPYDWLLALEAPKSGLIGTLIGKEEPRFVEDYIYGLGFIKTESSNYNPDNLPVGFSKTPSIYFKGLERHTSALGFTCAACHTGQFIHGEKRYIVDGGPATTDLGLLSKTLGAAIGQTELSGKFNLFDGRFERFARRVLKDNDNLLSRLRLKKELTATIESLKNSTDVIAVTEGFGRNDALNRIGNQVFKTDMNRAKNYHAVSAPVNYPHIWTTSWFDWVQYDGSIMQPLIRNSGEALGVKAYLNTDAPDQERFASSVNMHNLDAIEKWLGGTNPMADGVSQKGFNGLRAPKWPSSMPLPDETLVSQGELLYQKHCAGCHMPVTTSPEFWTDKYWKPISYYSSEGELQLTEEPYLKLKIIPVPEIGTDPAQAKVLPLRTVDTTGLDIDTQVCTLVEFEKDGQTISALKYVNQGDSATGNFGLSLGGVVSRTNDQWFKQNHIDQAKQVDMQGGRPNCLQVGQGYKARPLNGVWATAPFLHNGSVASIYDLLSPASDRPTFVELGNPEFDPKHLGIVQSKQVQTMNTTVSNQSSPGDTPDYSRNGYFILDTRIEGNYNTGHSFEGPPDHSGWAENGIIGPMFSEEQKMAIIEYLKTI